MDLLAVREEALSKAMVLRDRLKLLSGAPICALRGHDHHLRVDPVLGYFQVCNRCGAAQLLLRH